jgi:hypothetical protein
LYLKSGYFAPLRNFPPFCLAHASSLIALLGHTSPSYATLLFLRVT